MSLKSISSYPQFYMVELGCKEVYNFLIFNIDCVYSLEPHEGDSSNVYLQLMF